MFDRVCKCEQLLLVSLNNNFVSDGSGSTSFLYFAIDLLVFQHLVLCANRIVLHLDDLHGKKNTHASEFHLSLNPLLLGSWSRQCVRSCAVSVHEVRKLGSRTLGVSSLAFSLGQTGQYTRTASTLAQPPPAIVGERARDRQSRNTLKRQMEARPGFSDVS